MPIPVAYPGASSTMRSLRTRLAVAAATVFFVVLATALATGLIPAADLLNLSTPLERGAEMALLASLLACAVAVALAFTAWGSARAREAAATKVRADLEEEKTRLDAVLRLLPTGVLVADQKGRLVHANEEARRIWGGRSRIGAPATYRTCRARRPLTGELLAPGDWGLERALKTLETGRLELIEIDRFDGTRGEVLSAGAPILGKDGSLIGAVGVMQDLAALRKATTFPSEFALRPSPCDPHDLVADAAELLRALLSGQGLELSVAAEPGLPNVFCDRERVAQAIASLAASAAAGATGGPLRLEALSRDGEVHFRVQVGSAPRSGGFDLSFSLPSARTLGKVPLAPPGLLAHPPREQIERLSSSTYTGSRETTRADRPGRWPSREP